MDTQPYEQRRGLFDGLQPPLHPNMLLLALACVVGFHWIVLFLEWFMDADGLLLRVVTKLGFAHLHPGDLSPMHWAITVAVALAFWAFFATAINRIAAMMIAREEALGVGEAARFALKKFVPVLSSVLFVAVLYVVFYVIANATVFGWIGRIPYLGELLVAFFYPVVLLFTFFVVAAVLLGGFSFNLTSSVIATESSDTWDGISRAWNYVIVRPWTVILVLGLTVTYITVFSFAGSKFMSWSIDSLAIGGWGMGDRVELVKLKGAELDGDLRVRVYEEPTAEELKDEGRRKNWEDRKKALDERDFWVAVPGKVGFLRDYVSGSNSWRRVEFGIRPTEGEVAALKDRYDGFTGELANPAESRFAPRARPGSNNIAFLVPPTLKLSGVVLWVWRWLCIYLMAAFALAYLLSANTMLYFLLRKDVEGEDYTEIVVDEEELDDEAAWNVTEPQAPAAPQTKGAAGALIMPAKSLGGPPAALPPALGGAAPAAPAAPTAPAAPAGTEASSAKADKAPAAGGEASAKPAGDDAAGDKASPPAGESA